jgi:hypothetical protein
MEKRDRLGLGAGAGSGSLGTSFDAVGFDLCWSTASSNFGAAFGIGFFFFLLDTLNGKNRVALPTIFGSAATSSSFFSFAGSSTVSLLVLTTGSSYAGIAGRSRLNAASLLVLKLMPFFGAFCAVRFGAGKKLLIPLNAPPVRALFVGGPSAPASSFWPGSGLMLGRSTLIFPGAVASFWKAGFGAGAAFGGTGAASVSLSLSEYSTSAMVMCVARRVKDVIVGGGKIEIDVSLF